MTNKLIVKILLGLILIFSLGLRAYKLDSVPPSLTWDEAAVGYNSWTITNYGRDEYGNFSPLYFRSFGEDKQPVQIYTTALFVKFLGLSEFNIRLPAALFGTLNVLLIFFLGTVLFKSEVVGLIAAFFLCISPYNIFFSRFNHEANFALFFFMLGLILFFLSLKKYKSFLIVSTLCFLVGIISYHAAEIVIPPIIFLLLLLNFKKLSQNKINLGLSIFLIPLFLLMAFFNPRLLGTARFNQTVQGQSEIEKTWGYQKTKNLILGRINLIATQYSWHFTPKFLFVSGDRNPRLSSQGTGEFYGIDAFFLILGIIFLVYKRSKEGVLLLAWAAIAPLPSSLVGEAPHAGRASFMMGSWNLISALGFYFIITVVRKPIKIIIVLATVCILIFSLSNYLSYYYGEFANRYAIDWQYGMKQIVQFVKIHPEYDQIYMTDVRGQPYIFFLYYLKTPLSDYLRSMVLNNSEEVNASGNNLYNNIAFFDKYSFGGWDPIESFPTKGILYIVTPSQYDGLRHKLLFDVKKVIYYPNGSVAFYLVSAKQ